MAISLPNGATISIASTYGSPVTVTALTNADPAVATATGHGFTDGDLVEVTSGWSKLNSQIVRLAGSDVNTFQLEGINTTSTTKYPATSGTGSVREISAWTQITQVLETSTSGGEQQFTNYTFLEDDTERQIPTNKSAQSITLQLGDDATLPWYDIMATADEDRLPRAIRVQLPNGGVLLYNGYVTLNKTPSLTVNNVMALQATISLVAAANRYSA